MRSLLELINLSKLWPKAKHSKRRPTAEDQLLKLPPEQAEELEKLGAVVDERPPYKPAMMRIDLHCHSQASSDCRTPIEKIPARCLEQGIHVQAITDHNEIWGAQKLRDIVEELAPEEGGNLTVIIGEEVSTSEGEIIGLFLNEIVPPGLTPEETVYQIRRQGGLVLLPHGFDPLKRHRLKAEAVERIADDIDIVETFNARISRPYWNHVAVQWARENDALLSAGSDAHTLAHIGAAWVETPRRSVPDAESLLSALEGGIPEGQWTHPVLAFAYKTYDRLRSRLRRREQSKPA